MTVTSRAVPSRSARLGRGWAVASIATFTGVASHVAAMGHMPPVAVVAVCWALSGLFCVLLSGLRFSALSTGLGVLFTQGILHWLFAQAGEHAAPVRLAGTVHGQPAAEHTEHMMHGSSSAAMGMFAGGGHDELTLLMTMTHLAAALLTFVAIRRGDVALAVLRRAVRIGLERLVAMPARAVAVVPRFRTALIFRIILPLRHQARPGPVAVRGPPLLFV